MGNRAEEEARGGSARARARMTHDECLALPRLLSSSPAPMSGPRLHHVSVLVSDLDRALRFYEGLLGLQQVQRPELGYPGAWLSLGDQQIHLLRLPGPEADRTVPVGRDRHLALAVEDLEEVMGRLEDAGLALARSRSGREACFCRDPDGNGIELIAMR
jgi:glyoxylase I family protein